MYWAERVCAVAKGFPQPLEALDGGASGRAEREANGEYGATQAVEAAQVRNPHRNFLCDSWKFCMINQVPLTPVRTMQS